MASSPRISKADWEGRLESLLPLYGHRNWIVVADSAYPAQSRPGIETVVSGAGHLEVATRVLDQINASRHVRAGVYLDQELAFVAESDAPGVTRFRGHLATLLKGAATVPMLHEQIIARLDQVSQTFRVFIIKTDLTIPYSSIFFELGCAYWPPRAETTLRQTMSAAAK